jgi:hypothetical protein
LQSDGGFGVVGHEISFDCGRPLVFPNVLVKSFRNLLMAVGGGEGLVGNPVGVGANRYELRLVLLNSYMADSALEFFDQLVIELDWVIALDHILRFGLSGRFYLLGIGPLAAFLKQILLLRTVVVVVFVTGNGSRHDANVDPYLILRVFYLLAHSLAVLDEVFHSSRVFGLLVIRHVVHVEERSLAYLQQLDLFPHNQIRLWNFIRSLPLYRLRR